MIEVWISGDHKPSERELEAWDEDEYGPYEICDLALRDAVRLRGLQANREGDQRCLTVMPQTARATCGLKVPFVLVFVFLRDALRRLLS